MQSLHVNSYENHSFINVLVLRFHFFCLTLCNLAVFRSFGRSVCWFPCFVLTLGCYPCASVRLSAISFTFGGEGLYLEGLYMAGLIFGILPIEMHEGDSQFMILALFSGN